MPKMPPLKVPDIEIGGIKFNPLDNPIVDEINKVMNDPNTKKMAEQLIKNNPLGKAGFDPLKELTGALGGNGGNSIFNIF